MSTFTKSWLRLPAAALKTVTTTSSRWMIRYPRQEAIFSMAVALFAISSALAAAQNNTRRRELQHSQYGHLNNWQTSLPFQSDVYFTPISTREVGEGRSQIVSDKNNVYVFSGKSEKRKGKSTIVRSRLLCFDQSIATEKWARYSPDVEILKGQESFSGATACPRATPLLIDDCIVTVSYTGILECVAKESGKLLWKHDLVADLGATPVQFGFSSSPVANSNQKDRFYVTAAGPIGGLYCLSTADGSTVWKAKCSSFSYATPTFATFDGERQILAITRDEVLGIAESNGQLLWSHPFDKKGLTNVPSPIVLQDGFVISGQGVEGTCRVQITNDDGSWQASQLWKSRKSQFFYSNWCLLEPNMILGCDSQFLIAIDADNGSLLGKWRGFGDGNLVRDGNSLFIVDGKGSLNVLEWDPDNAKPGLIHLGKFSALEERCWTPPTIVPQGLLIRGGDQLTHLRFTEDDGSTIANKLKSSKRLNLKASSTNRKGKIDHVQNIFDTFESKGADAAMKMYSQLRAQVPCPLVADNRIELFNAAKQQGLNDLAKMILVHAIEDYPDSDEIRELAKELK